MGVREEQDMACERNGENENQRQAKYNILWGFPIHRKRVQQRNRLSIIVMNKVEHICYIVDVASPFDPGIVKRVEEKINIYDT